MFSTPRYFQSGDVKVKVQPRFTTDKWDAEIRLGGKVLWELHDYLNRCDTWPPHEEDYKSTAEDAIIVSSRRTQAIDLSPHGIDYSGIQRGWNIPEIKEASVWGQYGPEVHRIGMDEFFDSSGPKPSLPRFNPERREQRLKALPPGTDLSGSWNELKRWGDVMARVDADGFDPETVSRKYIVWLSDLPADERLQRYPMHFKHGNQPVTSQKFSFHDTRYMDRRGEGQLSEPITYLVSVDKFSDLTVSEDSQVQRVLRDKGYREAWKYPLTAPRWRKILAMTYDEAINHADYEIANAVDQLGSGWDFPGVYRLTKKGAIQWVVSRNQKGEGL